MPTPAAASENRPHPVFARCWERLSRLGEAQIGPFRAEAVAGLTGRVLELGAGNGLTFAHYPPTVTEVVAIEPEPYLRARAEAAAATAPVPVHVRAGHGEALDVPDASFDAVVACLVLCSVADPAATLAEIRRVLVPGGELRLLEHIHDSLPRKGAVQRGLDRSGLWPLIAGGCHCSRDTVASVEAAGFRTDGVRELVLGPRWTPINPVAIGTARRSS